MCQTYSHLHHALRCRSKEFLKRNLKFSTTIKFGNRQKSNVPDANWSDLTWRRPPPWKKSMLASRSEHYLQSQLCNLDQKRKIQNASLNCESFSSDAMWHLICKQRFKYIYLPCQIRNFVFALGIQLLDEKWFHLQVSFIFSTDNFFK